MTRAYEVAVELDSIRAAGDPTTEGVGWHVDKPQDDIRDWTPASDPEDPRTPFQRFEDLARRIITVRKRGR